MEFNFKISYRPGKQGENSDVLTRWSQNFPNDIKNLRQQHQFQTLLQDHQLDKDVKKALAVTFFVNTANETINKAIDNKVDKIVDGNEDIINVEKHLDKFSGNEDNSTLIPNISKDNEPNATKAKSLEKLFEKAYKDNEVVKNLINAKERGLQKLPMALIKKGIVLSIGDLKIKNERLYVKNRMYIPENEALQLYLLQQHYNLPIYSHPGYKTMY